MNAGESNSIRLMDRRALLMVRRLMWELLRVAQVMILLVLGNQTHPLVESLRDYAPYVCFTHRRVSLISNCIRYNCKFFVGVG